MTIRFNKNFYNLKTVEKASQAYQGLADFKISQNKKVITVKLENIVPTAKRKIEDEFCNYVLAMMKQ